MANSKTKITPIGFIKSETIPSLYSIKNSNSHILISLVGHSNSLMPLANNDKLIVIRRIK